MPITSKDKFLLHLPTPPPPGWLDTIAKRFPQLQVRWEIAEILDSDLANADTLPDEVWEGVTMLCVYPPASPERMKNVRFVQLPSAGWDRWPGHASFESKEVMFCSANGCQALPIAEWVIATWLSHSHHFNVYTEQQKNENWAMAIKSHPTTDSTGLRMGILGYGNIGRQVGRIAKALGMEIYAYTSSPRETPESRRHNGYTIPGTGDADGLIPSKWFSGASSDKDALNNFLSQDLDVLVLSLPGGSSTNGLLGSEQFKILSKKKTFVSNVARGSIIDTEALMDALNGGLIRGAALDVTDPEPLPKGHPLWKCPNVFISPHISWQSTTMVNHVAYLLLENLERLDRGEPLINQIRNN